MRSLFTSPRRVLAHPPFQKLWFRPWFPAHCAHRDRFLSSTRLPCPRSPSFWASRSKMQTLRCGAQANWLLKILLSSRAQLQLWEVVSGALFGASPLEAAHTICRQLLPCRPSCPVPRSTLCFSPLSPSLAPHPSPVKSKLPISVCQTLGDPLFLLGSPSSHARRGAAAPGPEACLLPGLPHRPGPFPPPVCHFPFSCRSLPDTPGI